MTRPGKPPSVTDDDDAAALAEWDAFPEPRIVRLTNNGVTRHYATWSEKPLEEILLGELRPYPALDAAVFLDGIAKGTRP